MFEKPSRGGSSEMETFSSLCRITGGISLKEFGVDPTRVVCSSLVMKCGRLVIGFTAGIALRDFDFSEVLVWKEGKTRFRVRAIYAFLNNLMHYFPRARCNLRRTWNPRTIASARKTYSTQSSSIKALAQPTYGRQPVTSLAKRLLRTKGKHILWVDLNEFKYGQDEVVHYLADVNSTNWNWLSEVLGMIRKLEMMNKLKQFVGADIFKPPSERIDSVQWNVDESYEPTEEMWQVLNGLSSPKHLKIVGGYLEECNVAPLKALQHQWNDLDTVTLVDHDFMDSPPDVFSRISSLTLEFCCGLNFIPPSATRLKHVRISENNVCDIFTYAVDHNPHFPQVLEVLEIESTNGCDFSYMYEPQDFRDRLRKCTNLREFRFATCYSNELDTDVAAYIPPSIEKLTLSFTRSLPFLDNFDDWIKHASDPTWLPYLKSFQLSIDPKSCVGGLEGERPLILKNPPREFTPEAFDMEFEGKRTALYNVLKSTRPSIDLFV